MDFLIDASLPRSAADVVRRHGHGPTDVRDIGLGSAPDDQVAQHARANRQALLTADFDFADIRHYSPQDYHGIAVIHRPENAKIAEVLELVERLFAEAEVVAALPGRLAIVDRRRIRLRPAVPGQP
jgi:predicted nuclease of predicted toxin-antitoxin system